MMNAVGGTTMHYWAQSWRLNPWDFKVVSETTRRYGAARIPANSTVEDWPFGLEELENFYDKVEYAIGVSGKAGNINGTLNTAGNIFEGPRSREYPMPPLRGSMFTEIMSDAASRLGMNPFQGPAAITTEIYDGRSPCLYHGFCNKGGCHVRAKSSTAFTTIPKAMETGNLEIVTHAQVTKIVSNTAVAKSPALSMFAAMSFIFSLLMLYCCPVMPTKIRDCYCCQNPALFLPVLPITVGR